MPLVVMLKSLVYTTTVKLISLYRWLELQIIKLCYKFLVRKGTEIAASVGIVFHFTEDGDQYSPESWTSNKETEALKKCFPKYNSLVHLNIFKKEDFILRLANLGTLGFAETYMDKIWDYCESEEDIAKVSARFYESDCVNYCFHPINRLISHLELFAFNMQTKQKSAEVIDQHYDLGNALYESFLDPYMQYTCGYWAKADNLNDAQIDKMELIAKKLDLKPGMRVCDIGMLCKFLAERHGVECVGVTISEEQAVYAREKCKGLNVEIRLQDYRDVDDKFDRMVVVGMLEHVGFQNYEEFFTVAHRNLADDGIFVVHTIGKNHASMPRTEKFMHKYIFPNGNLPTPSDLTKVTHGKFIIEDWHNFGPDYIKTLQAWIQNFNKNWPKVQRMYGPRFYRMWIYYLAACAGVFKSRRLQLWQIVLSKDGLRNEYRAAR